MFDDGKVAETMKSKLPRLNLKNYVPAISSTKILLYSTMRRNLSVQ